MSSGHTHRCLFTGPLSCLAAITAAIFHPELMAERHQRRPRDQATSGAGAPVSSIPLADSARGSRPLRSACRAVDKYLGPFRLTHTQRWPDVVYWIVILPKFVAFYPLRSLRKTRYLILPNMRWLPFGRRKQKLCTICILCCRDT